MKRLALVLGASLLLAGCGGKIPTTRYYMLEAHDVAAASATESLRIGVAPFRVDPPYDQDRIVYRADDDSAEVGFYAYYRWAAPLERMLPTLVADALQGVPGARFENAGTGPYEALLLGHVRRLEEIDGDGEIRVRVALDLMLVLEGKTVWTGSIDREAAVEDAGMDPLVTQMATLLQQGVESVRPELAAALRR